MRFISVCDRHNGLLSYGLMLFLDNDIKADMTNIEEKKQNIRKSFDVELSEEIH